MADPPQSAQAPATDGRDGSHPGLLARAPDIFAAAALCGLAAVSRSLVFVPAARVFAVFTTSETPESLLLDAVT